MRLTRYSPGYPSTKSVVDSIGAAVDMPVAPFQYLNCHDKSHLITFAGITSSDFLAPGNRSLFYRMQPLLVALYTCQGVPMLWEGEEFVDDYPLPPGWRGTYQPAARRALGIFL